MHGSTGDDAHLQGTTEKYLQTSVMKSLVLNKVVRSGPRTGQIKASTEEEVNLQGEGKSIRMLPLGNLANFC